MTTASCGTGCDFERCCYYTRPSSQMPNGSDIQLPSQMSGQYVHPVFLRPVRTHTHTPMKHIVEERLVAMCSGFSIPLAPCVFHMRHHRRTRSCESSTEALQRSHLLLPLLLPIHLLLLPLSRLLCVAPPYPCSFLFFQSTPLPSPSLLFQTTACVHLFIS